MLSGSAVLSGPPWHGVLGDPVKRLPAGRPAVRSGFEPRPVPVGETVPPSVLVLVPNWDPGVVPVGQPLEDRAPFRPPCWRGALLGALVLRPDLLCTPITVEPMVIRLSFPLPAYNPRVALESKSIFGATVTPLTSPHGLKSPLL